MALSPKTKITLCILLNAGVLLLICALIGLFSRGGAYLSIGWSDHLVLLDIPINSAPRYFSLIILVCLVKIADVVGNEISGPILGFSIYNPDKKIITDFTKNELQILANTSWLINGTKGIFMVMINISQIDIAFLTMFFGEVASFFTIRMLLNEKTFTKNCDGDDEIMLQDTAESPV